MKTGRGGFSNIREPFDLKRAERSFSALASFRLSHRVFQTCSFAKASPKPKNPRSEWLRHILKRSKGTEVGKRKPEASGPRSDFRHLASDVSLAGGIRLRSLSARQAPALPGFRVPRSEFRVISGTLKLTKSLAPKLHSSTTFQPIPTLSTGYAFPSRTSAPGSRHNILIHKGHRAGSCWIVGGCSPVRKSGRGLPQSKTWRDVQRSMTRASVLECASPLALCAARFCRKPVEKGILNLQRFRPALDAWDGNMGRRGSDALPSLRMSFSRDVLLLHDPVVGVVGGVLLLIEPILIDLKDDFVGGVGHRERQVLHVRAAQEIHDVVVEDVFLIQIAGGQHGVIGVGLVIFGEALPDDVVKIIRLGAPYFVLGGHERFVDRAEQHGCEDPNNADDEQQFQQGEGRGGFVISFHWEVGQAGAQRITRSENGEWRMEDGR